MAEKALEARRTVQVLTSGVLACTFPTLGRFLLAPGPLCQGLRE